MSDKDVTIKEAKQAILNRIAEGLIEGAAELAKAYSLLTDAEAKEIEMAWYYRDESLTQLVAGNPDLTACGECGHSEELHGGEQVLPEGHCKVPVCPCNAFLSASTMLGDQFVEPQVIEGGGR